MGQVTVKTIAAALGVSATTVSNAYNKPERLSAQLRGKILAKATELGYSGPNAAGRALRSGKANAYGVVFGEQLSYAFSDPYTVIFLAGLAEAMQDAAASIVLLPVPPSGSSDMTAVHQAAVDGLVSFCVDDSHPALKVAALRGIPVVSTDLGGDGDLVAIDDRAAGRLVGRHLRQLGHRRITVIIERSDTPADAIPVELSPSQAAKLMAPPWPGHTGHRLLGLLDGQPDAELRFLWAGHNARESGRAAAALALDHQDRPTAIVGVSDVLAFGVLDALRARGLQAGRDISVIGFDDLPESQAVGLTTVRQPIAEKGRLAGRLLLDPNLPNRRVVLPIELVVRASTGPAPKPAR